MSDDVRRPTKHVRVLREQWVLINALLGGTPAMRKARQKFLPQWPMEDDGAYKTRLGQATLFPAFARTIEVMSGKPMQREVALKNVPKQMEEWLGNCDLNGANLHTFAAYALQQTLAYGFCGAIVDYPVVSGAKTRADEQAQGARPYFTFIEPLHILGWQCAQQNGTQYLTQLRLLETVARDDGQFGETSVEQVRVWYPDHWETYQEDPNKRSDWALVAEGRNTLNRIPFVPFYGKRKGFMQSVSPLMELAYLNVEHWQSSSDQQNITHIARVPLLVMEGGDETTQVTMSAQQAVRIPTGTSLKFVEHTGSAIAAGVDSIDSLEDRMRLAGAELVMLRPGTRTVMQASSDAEANSSTLHRIVEVFEDSLDECLVLMGAWVGIGREAVGNCELYKDFGLVALSDTSAATLLQMSTAGKLSDETLFDEFKRRGMISADADWEAEQERIQQASLQASAPVTLPGSAPSEPPQVTTTVPTQAAPSQALN